MTANELATMMNVPVVKVIGTCMSLGMPVSINQRLDAEALSVVAEEFGFQVDFVSADVQEAIAETEENDREEDLVPRAPVRQRFLSESARCREEAGQDGPWQAI